MAKSKKNEDTPAEETTEAGAPASEIGDDAAAMPVRASDIVALAEEIRDLQAKHADLMERALDLEESVARLSAENARMRADVALALTTVDRVRREAAKGVISTETTLTLAEFRAVREAGRTRFLAAADCRHHRITINRGADIDLRDYDLRDLDALVGEGLLRLSALPME